MCMHVISRQNDDTETCARFRTNGCWRHELGGYTLMPEEELGSSRNATRKSVRLIIIQDIYSQRAVRLKTGEIYCDFCCEDLVCFDNLIFCLQFNKKVLNNFVYISHFTFVKFQLYLCMSWSMNMTFKVALKYSRLNCNFLQGN
jgi:hypothetical protein